MACRGRLHIVLTLCGAGDGKKIRAFLVLLRARPTWRQGFPYDVGSMAEKGAPGGAAITEFRHGKGVAPVLLQGSGQFVLVACGEQQQIVGAAAAQ